MNRKQIIGGVIGQGFVLLALAIFLSLLFASTYRLTPEVFSQVVRPVHMTDLATRMQPMMGKVYSNQVVFVGEVESILNELNDAYRAASQWDKVIYDPYVASLTKASTRGWVVDYGAELLLLIFGMASVGALLYMFFVPTDGKAGPFHSSLTHRGWMGVLVGTFLLVFYVLLYFFDAYITNWIWLVQPLKQWIVPGSEASQWFLYGFLYTFAVLVMGVRMIRNHWRNNYQVMRTISVMFFQTVLAFLLPEILVRLNQPYFDFKNMWPLDYDFFDAWHIQMLASSGGTGVFMLVWGITLFVVGVPVFTYFFGKRWYCSWVCGCGGLAETVGDPFRQLSDKSLFAWKIERWMIHGILVFTLVMTLAVIYNFVFGTDTIFGFSTYTYLRRPYGFLIGSVFSGVVGTGFYPFMGNRVWCRFGCPLAAYLGIVQRFASRFRITVNGGQCISCGQCSTYCEMGIDVRWYAQRGQNVVRSSCVGCGICSAVCPRGVLRLENK